MNWRGGVLKIVFWKCQSLHQPIWPAPAYFHQLYVCVCLCIVCVCVFYKLDVYMLWKWWDMRYKKTICSYATSFYGKINPILREKRELLTYFYSGNISRQPIWPSVTMRHHSKKNIPIESTPIHLTCPRCIQYIFRNFSREKTSQKKWVTIKDCHMLEKEYSMEAQIVSVRRI